MKYITVKNNFFKISMISLFSVFSLAINAAEGDPAATAPTATTSVGGEGWGSPVATFSNVNLGSGTEGIDLSAKFGGYLGGLYQQRLELAAKQDLEHYEINFLLFNTASESGITIDSTLNENVDFDNLEGAGSVYFENVNSVEVGLFSKLKFPDERVSAYPRMVVGYMWGNDILDTTYVKFEVALRFYLSDKIWVGGSPFYIRSMEGVEIEEFQGTADAGIKLSETFGVSASIDHDQNVLGRVIFAF